MSTLKVGIVITVAAVASAAAWWMLQAGGDRPDAGASASPGFRVAAEASTTPATATTSRPEVATVTPIAVAPFREGTDSESAGKWHVRGRVVQRPAGMAADDPKAEGPPVPGATVKLKAYPGRERRVEPQDMASAISAKDGSFDLAVAAPTSDQTWRAVIDGDEWSGSGAEFFAGLGDPEPAPQLIRAVRFDAEILGTVKTTDGAPIVGAQVGWVKKVATGAEGAYRLPIVASQRSVWMMAHAKGFQVERRQVESPAAGASIRVDFTLSPECVVEGIVRRPDGTPLAGATVWTYAGGGLQSVITPEDGSFRLGGFALESEMWSQSVTVEAPGFLPADRAPIFVERKCRLEFTLRPGMPVRGVVVDGEGAPLAGVKVRFGGKFSSVQVACFSDRDGRFFAAAAPPGPQQVAAEKAGLVETSQAIDVPLAGLDGLRIVMSAGHRAGGRVLDEDGKPLGGLLVAGRHRGRYVDARAKTAADGRFMLEALPAEGLEAEVYGQGYLRKTGPIVAGRDDAVIVMARNGKLAGTVVDAATSAPLRRFTVRIVAPDASQDDRPGDGYSSTWGDGGHLIEAPDGVWRIDGEDLEPGAVLGVEIRAEGFAAGTYSRLVIEAEPDPKAHVLALRKAATVGGIVVTTTGAPVTAAAIHVVCENQRARWTETSWSVPPPHATTDAAGKFTVRDAPFGAVFIRVAAGDRPPFFAGPYSVSEGGSLADLRIVLPEGAVVSGVVVGANGRPVAGTTVQLDPMNGGSGMTQRHSITDAEGRFAFRGLSAGAYFVGWRIDGSGNDLTGIDLVLAAEETIAVRLPPDAPCSARLRIEIADPFPAELIVHATPVGGLSTGLGRARRTFQAKSAEFEVDHLDAGEYRFYVSSYSNEDSARGFANAIVVPGAPVEVKIKLERTKRGG